jgi:hypothetical protein
MGSNSLGAQLLKAGLINKKQVNKAKQEQYKTKKKQGGKDEQISESRQLAQKALAEAREQARQLNLERKQQEEQKEILAQISQMIGSARIKIENGQLTYNFIDNKKIKKIYVTKTISEQLSTGQLAIVKHNDRYEVVPAEVAQKITARNSASVIVLHKPQHTTDKNDPYAEFPVPDDLDW